MSYSAEAAEQVVRMSLNGVEVAAKISGKAVERLATLLFAICRGQKKTKGKARLTSMLRSGKELKVFAVKDSELQKFCQEAKRYGVLYCVLKDNKANDGLTDIMVRADDGSKVNRIFERFNLATIDMGTVKAEIQKDREPVQTGEDIPVPEKTDSVQNALDDFLNAVVPEKVNPTSERSETENPTMGRTTKSSPSEPLLKTRNTLGENDRERVPIKVRPSVRKELEEIREEQNRPQDTRQASLPELRQTKHTDPALPKRRVSKEANK